MVPPIVLAVPIFDTSLVIVSRLRRGLNPLTTPGLFNCDRFLRQVQLAVKFAF